MHSWDPRIAGLYGVIFTRLILAMFLGALIGAERQWRQRVAGLRTNALVAFGAAAFVDITSQISGASDVARVIASIVAGIGFLGGGAIIKDGLGVRGMNTAATIWCSAAVGAFAGAGALLDAVFVTFFLVTINLSFRPLSRWIDQKALARTEASVIYTITVVCGLEADPLIHPMILKELSSRRLFLREIQSGKPNADNCVTVDIEIESLAKADASIEEIADIMRRQPSVSLVRWSVQHGDRE